MRVHMDCAGCESKVKSSLKKLKGIIFFHHYFVMYLFFFIFYLFSRMIALVGQLILLLCSSTGVDDIDIDMAMQKVTVTGWADQKKVLKAVRKTGRRAELWQLPYSPAEQHGYYNQHQCNGPVTHYAHQPSSSYNYYKHGYDSQNHAYYHYPAVASIFSNQTGSTFSDENPHACSIM